MCSQGVMRDVWIVMDVLSGFRRDVWIVMDVFSGC